MSKLFLSVLGTGAKNNVTGKFEYQSCEYVLDGERLPTTRYVQEASIRHFCKGWNSSVGDRIKILCTEESFEKQWNGEDKLSSCLKKLGSQPEYASLEMENVVAIMPRGKTKEELWKVFEVLFASVNAGDEIWLDVTHGFRSLPMLVLTAIPYLRLLKKAEVKSITYGAYESRNEDGSVPVFDLTDFLNLMDWTNAATNFVEYGRFDGCKKLMGEANRNILKETRGKDEEAALCRDISNKVDDFCQKILQNRLDAAVVKGLPEGVVSGLQNLKSRSLRVAPFQPIVEKIEEKLQVFSRESLENVFDAVDWCVEHRFLQNGYSILLEGCISIAMQKLVKDGTMDSSKLNDEDARQLPIHVATPWVRRRDDVETAEYMPFRDSVFVGKFEYAQAFEMLNKTRNAFMHCGTGSNKLPSGMGDLEKNLRESNELLRKWYKELGV